MPASWLAIDLQRRTLSFRSSDGRGLDIPMPADMFPNPTNLQRIELDVDAARLMITMPAKHAVVELRRPGQDLDELRTTLHGAPRVALAGTVLTLGRGWQMRNPLHVRVEEMLHAVRGVEPVAAEVFAPSADGFFSSVGEPAASPSARPEMPTELEQIGRLVPDVLGLYDAVVDEQAIPDEEAQHTPPPRAGRGGSRSWRPPCERPRSQPPWCAAWQALGCLPT